MKSNPRYVVRRARTPEPLWWIIDTQDRFGDIECRTRREARDKCREMNRDVGNKDHKYLIASMTEHK